MKTQTKTEVVYKYVLVSKTGKYLYHGISKRPKRREYEHRYEGKNFHKLLVLSKHSSRSAAHKVEGAKITAHKKRNGGRRPKYNKTNLGDKFN